MAVPPIPEGFHTITPYLSVEGADRFIDFVKTAFKAKEMMRIPSPDGSIMHAQVLIGDSPLMMTEACEKLPAMPASIYLYVEDTDATYARSIVAGAVSIHDPADQFYGDRSSGVKDPFGNLWWIGTQQEIVSPEKLKQRMASFQDGQ